MHAGPEHLPQLGAGAPQLPTSSSLAARRSAASSLPSNFELPPPPLAALQNKYQPFHGPNGLGPDASPSGHVTSVGSLLTPPNTLPSEQLSPSSSASNSGAPGPTDGQPARAQQHGAQPFNPGYWAPPGQGQQNSQVGYSSGSTPQWIPPRGLFSPPLNNLRSGPDGHNMASPSSYEAYQLPPFGSQIASQNQPPNMTLAQAEAQQHALLMSAHPQHVPTTQPSPVASQDAFQQRPPPPPSYYSSNSLPSQPSITTPQHSAYPYTSGSSPGVASPMSAASHPGARLSPQDAFDHPMSASSLPPSYSHQQPQSPHQYTPHQRAYSHPFSLPAMPLTNGPVMSNIHSPGGQMALVGAPGGLNGTMIPGAFHSGHAASMPHLYRNPMSPQQGQPPHQSPESHSPQLGSHHRHTSHGGPHQTPGDRPFKCDQCVQSFNRNHDLKRHKRIHLAVKPYPCGHCDKSFSRKDALKRHILVKGCGKTGSGNGPESGSGQNGSGSVSSDKTDGSLSPVSPVVNGLLVPSNDSPRLGGIAA